MGPQRSYEMPQQSSMGQPSGLDVSQRMVKANEMQRRFQNHSPAPSALPSAAQSFNLGVPSTPIKAPDLLGWAQDPIKQFPGSGPSAMAYADRPAPDPDPMGLGLSTLNAL